MSRRIAQARFAICVCNDGFVSSLELRKPYRVLQDELAERRGMIRVVDESGEDYRYPSAYFVALELPDAAEAVFADASSADQR